MIGMFTRTVLAGAHALGLTAPAAAQVDNVFFFGDSLPDVGSYQPIIPARTCLFMTNPGSIWATVFANLYGFTAVPGNQSCNDFAEGGARVSQLPGVPNSPPTATATPVVAQITNLLARGAL